MKLIFRAVKRCFTIIRTWIICMRSGLPFDGSWFIGGGKIIVKRTPWYYSHFYHLIPGKLVIGKNFRCANSSTYNSIGVIQPCLFNVSQANSCIEIGDNVGISGTTINASTLVKIGNNVLIGSGCLISDTDSHPLNWADRLCNDTSKIKSKPIIIEDSVFIGARCIILKGVTIGKGSVIGAGSVVVNSIPENVIACGNPAKVVRKLSPENEGL